jgi:hypothetical protein
MVSGAGERPAKKLAHQPWVCFLRAFHSGEPTPIFPTYVHRQHPSLGRRWSACAGSVGVYRSARSGSARVCPAVIGQMGIDGILYPGARRRQVHFQDSIQEKRSLYCSLLQCSRAEEGRFVRHYKRTEFLDMSIVGFATPVARCNNRAFFWRSRGWAASHGRGLGMRGVGTAAGVVHHDIDGRCVGTAMDVDRNAAAHVVASVVRPSSWKNDTRSDRLIALTGVRLQYRETLFPARLHSSRRGGP